MRLMNKKIAKSSENQGNWKLTRVNSVTGHPSQELQVSSTSFFSPSYFLCNPVFVGFDEILFWQNAIFTLNVYNGQSQSVPGAFTVHVLFENVEMMTGTVLSRIPAVLNLSFIRSDKGAVATSHYRMEGQ